MHFPILETHILSYLFKFLETVHDPNNIINAMFVCLWIFFLHRDFWYLYFYINKYLILVPISMTLDNYVFLSMTHLNTIMLSNCIWILYKKYDDDNSWNWWLTGYRNDFLKLYVRSIDFYEQQWTDISTWLCSLISKSLRTYILYFFILLDRY